MRLTAALPLLVAAGLLSGGCGQADDRRAVRDVAQAFGAALERHDGAAACALLTDPLVTELESQERAPCAQAVLDLGLTPAPVTGSRVYVTSGQVELADGETAYLDRARAGWRLSAIGCRFEQGKPQDRPATCEAQA